MTITSNRNRDLEAIEASMIHRHTFSRTRSWKDSGKRKSQFRGSRKTLKFED